VTHVKPLLLALLLSIATLGLYRQLLDGHSFRSRDHFDFYLRVDQYRAEVNAGHWPQTLPGALRGGGHAFPRFYPPVSHLAALAADVLTGDVVRATHLAALAAVVLSVAGQFLLLFRLTGSPYAAVAAAAAYAAFPYRFTQVYERGAFAEVWAMAWYPLILLGGVMAIQRHRPPSWWPLPIALLVLSQSVMAVWTLPVLGLLLLAATTGPGRRFMLGAGLVAGGWALGLVAFYALPVAAGLDSVRAADPLIMLATPAQVAKAGLANIWPRSMALNLLTALVGGGYLLVVRKRLRATEFPARLLTLSLVAVIVLAAMMMAPERVWSLTPQAFRYLQFPWRLLGPAAFLGTVAMGLAFARFKPLVATGFAAFFLVLGWLEGGMDTGPREYSGTRIVQFMATSYPDLGLTLAGEYLPREAVPESLALAVGEARDRVGTGPLKAWDGENGSWVATIETGSATEVPVPLVAYDFLRVTTVSGGPVRVASREGQLVLEAPPGRTEVLVSRQLPAPLGAGLSVSALTLLSLVLWARRRRLP
jgi:hypothetical protein